MPRRKKPPAPEPCQRCKARPRPPAARSGTPPAHCLSCARELGHRWERTLQRLAKREGFEAAQAAAVAGGVELPESVLAVCSDAPRAAAPAGGLTTAPALRSLLLAAGLSIDPDPHRAAELVGLEPGPDLDELAKQMQDHPIRKGDTRAVASIISAAGAVTALRALGHAGAGEPVKAAKSAAASKSMWAAHESLTGGGKPTPSHIELVFRKAGDQ